MNKMLSKSLLGACAAVAIASTANAGGLERGGYNIDLLFDPARVAGEVSGTYVMPDRTLENVVDVDPSDGTLGGPTGGIKDTESYWVPRIGFKAGIGEAGDCMVDYSQPWGAHSNPGKAWAGANSNIETDIKSNNYAATCSYKMQMGKGQLRFIGGFFYQEVYGFKERLVSPLVPGRNGTGRVDLEGDGWGWRAGIAYEIPEIALRASLVYNSEVDLGDITGTLDLRNVGMGAPAIYGTAAMPDSVEFKVQSGIAPDWLAFGSIKWVDWSQLQSIAICSQASKGLAPCLTTSGPPVKLTSLDLMYRDGWTISGGIGHKFNDQWSGAAAVTWDRGTSTGLGTQTDTWTLSGGVSFTPNENVEMRLGGAIGLLTSGSSGAVVGDDGITYGDDITYTFDNDLVTALNASLKVKW